MEQELCALVPLGIRCCILGNDTPVAQEYHLKRPQGLRLRF